MRVPRGAVEADRAVAAVDAHDARRERGADAVVQLLYDMSHVYGVQPDAVSYQAESPCRRVVCQRRSELQDSVGATLRPKVHSGLRRLLRSKRPTARPV